MQNKLNLNKINLGAFEDWMQQPGLTKQLQLYLAIAVLIILFLIMQIINMSINASPKARHAYKQEINSEQKQASKQIQSKRKVSKAEAQAFANDYLENFFAISEEALLAIESNTEPSLFNEVLKAQLDARREQELASSFSLSNMLIESSRDGKIKVICFGNEIFNNGDYENRQLSIELILDLEGEPGQEKLKTIAIPVFSVR